jgi:RNA polymerase sigma-70 factor (sigma-E family)
MKAARDAEFADYVAARMPSFRRLAVLLCHDWQRADDLVQAAITKLYVHWHRAKTADHMDAYVRAIVVREFLDDRRSSWVKRVALGGLLPDAAVVSRDPDLAMDLDAALALLPPGQRATLVLRFYSDLSVEQSAEILGCSAGTVKSQTAKALDSLRSLLGPEPGRAAADSPRGTHRDSLNGELA